MHLVSDESHARHDHLLRQTVYLGTGPCISLARFRDAFVSSRKPIGISHPKDRCARAFMRRIYEDDRAVAAVFALVDRHAAPGRVAFREGNFVRDGSQLNSDKFSKLCHSLSLEPQ